MVSESVSPVHDCDYSSAIASATSASDGQNGILRLGNDAMGEGPRNMSGGPVPIPAAANSHDNCAGYEPACESRDGFYGMTELHVDLDDALAQICIGRCFDLFLRLFSDSDSFGARSDAGIDRADHGHGAVELFCECRKARKRRE